MQMYYAIRGHGLSLAQGWGTVLMLGAVLQSRLLLRSYRGEKVALGLCWALKHFDPSCKLANLRSWP
jgi:hypothetical protein